MRNILLGLALVGFVSWRLTWFLIRTLAIRYTTILQDIPLLRLPPPKPEQRIQGNAVVVGGSVAGLLTARILVDYFTNVTIIEADMTLESFGSRVGQRGHLHIYSALCYMILQSLFTGFKDRAVEMGVVIQRGFRMTLGGSKVYSSIESLNISRLTFESLLRRLLFSHAGPALEIIDGTVTGFKASEDGNMIESILYRHPTGDTASITTLKCSFLADCSGPASISSKYLVSNSVGASWGPFPKHQYSPVISYVSALWHVPERLRDRIARLLPREDPDYGKWEEIPLVFGMSPNYTISKEAYGIQRLDGDRLLFLHAGWGLDRLVQNVSELVQVVHMVQNETYGDSTRKKQHEWIIDILNLILEEEPDIDATVKFMPYKLTVSHWVEFEAGSIPDNFIAVGDSRMRVNPIFGQGVGKVLTDITILNTHFRDLFSKSHVSLPPTIPPSFSRGYFDREKSIVQGIYDTNRALDYGYESTIPEEGETREYGKWFREYIVDVSKMIENDRRLSEMVMKVLNGVEPGVELFHPWVALRVFVNRWMSK